MAQRERARKMIQTINELQEYILKDADDFDELMMTSPGCSKERIRDLKATLPGIPDSYTKWVEALNLNGISIGYFEVSPCSFHSEDMVANVIQGNEDGIMFWDQMRQYHLYSIATTDDYGIFVATSSSSYREGEIIIIDEDIYAEEDTPEKYIHKLAKNFEQFLIAAGNLNQIHQEINDDNSNWEEKKAEFIGRLKTLGVSEEYHPAWLSVF
jgi:hypothetical protein